MSSTKIPLLLTAFLGLCAISPAADHQLPGRVLRVADGDSLVLEVGGGQYQIELAGIDAPELNQPWGPAAADRLNSSLTGAFVVVARAYRGTDGRTTGTVVFKDRDIALDLLYDGLAWSTIETLTKTPGPAHPYTEAERRARVARRGLWSDDEPVPPWDWRRQGP
jgi:endonuclease YncB( thermonuclease family)